MNHYAGTSLSCAGIQRWKSVSFRCWVAINWLMTWAMTSRTPHSHPTHPFPSSLCEEFCMSDNMCISCPPAAVPAYWDPGGSARFFTVTYIWNLQEIYVFHIYINSNYTICHKKFKFIHMYLSHVYVYIFIHRYCGNVTYIVNLVAIFVLSYWHQFHWCVSNQHRSHGSIFAINSDQNHILGIFERCRK